MNKITTLHFSNTETLNEQTIVSDYFLTLPTFRGELDKYCQALLPMLDRKVRVSI